MYAVKNRYYKHSKLDEDRFRNILELFAQDITAVQCAKETGVNVRSVNSIYLKLRYRIADWCENNASATPGLNASQIKQMREEDVPSNYIDSEADGVIGVYLYLMNNDIYCALLNGTKPPDNVEVVEGQWREYPVGIDVRRDMRLKIKNSTYQSAHAAGDIERIEEFGHFLRQRLTKFKGLRREKFYFHLKESEYRFNHQDDEDLFGRLLGMLGEAPIE